MPAALAREPASAPELAVARQPAARALALVSASVPPRELGRFPEWAPAPAWGPAVGLASVPPRDPVASLAWQQVAVPEPVRAQEAGLAQRPAVVSGPVPPRGPAHCPAWVQMLVREPAQAPARALGPVLAPAMALGAELARHQAPPARADRPPALALVKVLVRAKGLLPARVPVLVKAKGLAPARLVQACPSPAFRAPGVWPCPLWP